jgi:chromosome segregation protein
LERTGADLIRLHDLVGELSRQMRPLKRQASAAERQAELTADVRALRLFLGGEKLRGLDDRASRLAGERAGLDQQTSDAAAELAELASALHILTSEAGEVGEALDRDTAAAARLETILERLRRSASVAKERHHAGTARRDGAEERRRDLLEEHQALETELAALHTEVGEAAVVAERAERRFRTLEDEARSLADQGTLTPEGALAVLRGDVRSLEAADHRDRREFDQVERRLEVIAAQITAESTEIDRLNDEIRHLDEEASIRHTAYDKAMAARTSQQQRWDSLEADHSEARLAVAAARARLEAVVGAAAGLADVEARALVESAAGNRGSLSSLLSIPGPLAAAVDAALGPWADAVVFADREHLEKAVTALKSAGRGGVPVVAGEGGGFAPARLLAKEVGVEALVDLLGDGVETSLAERLLGDVVVVEGWSSAWRIVGRHPEMRAVTPEGDLVSVDGIRIAHPDGATPAMVEQAEVEVEHAETELARSSSLMTSGRRDFDAARSNERRSLEDLESLEAKMAGATEALARLERSRTSLEGDRARLEERRTALAETAEERSSRLERLRERVASLEGEEAERQHAWEEIEARRSALETDRERARASWQQAAADLRAATERLGLLGNRRQVVAATLETDLAEPVNDDDLERFALVQTVARAAIEKLSSRLGELRTRQAELRTRVGSTGFQRDAVRTRHEATRVALEGFRRRIAEIEVEAAETSVRRENIVEGLRRDADADEAAALAAIRPSVDGAGSDVDLDTVLDDLEARLRRMGPVNPLAAQEYAELEERHGFLTDQLTDLEASRNEVRRVISALDEEIQTRFSAAFDEVAEAYEENFSILFPGGSGRLSLTDPDDPLTSGLEIGAQPLGKKVSQLSLLSGGERSLAALAFLFAVFKARPSPFYILDEVEASLDDANLRRFLRLVDAFRGRAQLVVVTHQQQTMEAANVLYGVTMEPGGSSAVVRKELTAASGHMEVTYDVTAAQSTPR